MHDASPQAQGCAPAGTLQAARQATLEVCKLAERVLSADPLAVTVDPQGWIDAAQRLPSALAQAKPLVEANESALRTAAHGAATIAHVTRPSFHEVAIALGDEAERVAETYQQLLAGSQAVHAPPRIAEKGLTPEGAREFVQQATAVAERFLRSDGKPDDAKLILAAIGSPPKLPASEWANLRAMLAAESQRAATSDRPAAVFVADTSGEAVDLSDVDRAVGRLSPDDLSRRYGVPKPALEARLRRFREGTHAGWIEVSNRKPREPQFLYDPAAVQSIIDALRASGETSGQRRAKKIPR